MYNHLQRNIVIVIAVIIDVIGNNAAVILSLSLSL